MTIWLIRHHMYSQTAVLASGGVGVQIVERTLNPAKEKPYWLPDVPRHGWFDLIEGVFVAIYRDPKDPDNLWLQMGSERFALTGASRSTFSPVFGHDDEPLLENSSILRTFELYENDRLLAARSYRLDDYQKRLNYGIDPFPAWPDDESNYDLLLYAHQIIAGGAWARVFVPKESLS